MNRLHLASFFASSLLLCSPQFGVAQQVAATDFTLKNGLKVVLVEDHSVPSICVALAVRVGSRNERPGITGISHLFEHMMFNGSKKYPPGEFDRILENGGGYSNAYTSNDLTFYYEEFNPDLLDRVLDMEADRLHSLKIDTSNLEQERGIVKEERRVSTDNNVQSKMFEDLYAAAYVAHTYHHPVVGWMKDLDNISVDDARQYFKTYYAPNNITAVVVGDFDAQLVRTKVEKAFASIPRQSAPRQVIDDEPDQEGERRVMLHKAAELPAVAIAYKGVAISSPDYYALSLLGTILSRGQSSRLYQTLVYNLQMATSVGAGMDEHIDQGLFTFYAQVQPGHAVAEAEATIYAVIDSIARDGVGEVELQKARNAAQVDYVNDFKTNVGIAGRLGYYDVLTGDYRKSFNVLDGYATVTAADIQRVAAQYLIPRTRTVVVLVPENPEGVQE